MYGIEKSSQNLCCIFVAPVQKWFIHFATAKRSVGQEQQKTRERGVAARQTRHNRKALWEIMKHEKEVSQN